ncbi:class I SAM-dependent methyltransferase [Blastococcus sp. SYSU D00669]
MDDVAVFWALHSDLPREGVGSDATTRELLALARPLPGDRALDIGCGPGRSALVLAREGLQVTAVDTHEPFLDRLRSAAADRGLAVTAEHASMTALPYADGAFDLLWCEGAAYLMGVDEALRTWRRPVVPGGALVFTEVGWTTASPSEAARGFWSAYPAMRDEAATVAAAEAAGYDVLATRLLPESDWWDEYYGPLAERIAALASSEPDPDEGTAAALAAARAEIDLRREHPGDYGCTGYVLRRR